MYNSLIMEYADDGDLLGKITKRYEISDYFSEEIIWNTFV